MPLGRPRIEIPGSSRYFFVTTHALVVCFRQLPTTPSHTATAMRAVALHNEPARRPNLQGRAVAKVALQRPDRFQNHTFWGSANHAGLCNAAEH